MLYRAFFCLALLFVLCVALFGCSGESNSESCPCPSTACERSPCSCCPCPSEVPSLDSHKEENGVNQ